MKNKSFVDYFKFPLKYINSIMVNTSDNKRAFDFLVSWREDDKVKNYIVGTLNGEVLPIPGELEISNDYKYENCEVYLKDKKIMRIRGWGHLTGKGVGGLGLSTEDAIEIQDKFGEFITKKLKFTE